MNYHRILPGFAVTIVTTITIVSVFGNNSASKEPVATPPATLNTLYFAKNNTITANHNSENILKNESFVQGFALPTGPKQYNTQDDDSITKFVSRSVGLDQQSYAPQDLRKLSGNILTLSNNSLQLRSQAAAELESMALEFTNIFNKKLVVVSAYRSYKYQKDLKKKGCSDTLCAPAGHSEHQLGLAVDLFAATTADQFLSKKDFAEYYKRLASNAHRYGRHNTYQKGVTIDTYQVEPRHRRYVGRDLATELYDKKMTFGEWIKSQKK